MKQVSVISCEDNLKLNSTVLYLLGLTTELCPMDALRTLLMQQQGNGVVSGCLFWMGSTAFGARRWAFLCAPLKCSFLAHPLFPKSRHNCSTEGPASSWGTAYRKLLQTSWAQSLSSGLSLRPGYVASQADRPHGALKIATELVRDTPNSTPMYVITTQSDVISHASTTSCQPSTPSNCVNAPQRFSCYPLAR